VVAVVLFSSYLHLKSLSSSMRQFTQVEGLGMNPAPLTISLIPSFAGLRDVSRGYRNISIETERYDEILSVGTAQDVPGAVARTPDGNIRLAVAVLIAGRD
jgi:hypothetical protein